MSMDDKVPIQDQEQYTYENAAKARRIVIVDGSGNIIKSSQIEENRLGSEMSGSDGATNRVLTLQNTSESSGPISCWVEDQLIDISDLTLTHNSSSSTVEFANQIFDADSIRIFYYI